MFIADEKPFICFHEVKQSWSVEVPVSETSCRKSSLRHAKKKITDALR
ncbi:hypothetical protein BFO_2843 [Tannerella forsythia 92A2]|uniref:Uncharacterized protein n=1 Tax=Tannerella forsythia (strain ATCC 43037 / JCM 10827 / CCUG 21028 A / KCTC 5666 / FDC 338) TaxID=203275 RepID=G8UNB9_TANFA|nr:hypothetical protein BFO_2843 [Tannerella forsythia 92A2]